MHAPIGRHWPSQYCCPDGQQIRAVAVPEQVWPMGQQPPPVQGDWPCGHALQVPLSQLLADAQHFVPHARLLGQQALSMQDPSQHAPLQQLCPRPQHLLPHTGPERPGQHKPLPESAHLSSMPQQALPQALSFLQHEPLRHLDSESQQRCPHSLSESQHVPASEPLWMQDSLSLQHCLPMQPVRPDEQHRPVS